MQWHFVLMGAASLAVGARAFGPIYWTKFPGKRLFLMPEGLRGSIRGLVPPQRLTIKTRGSVSPNMFPQFTFNADRSITWDPAGWCMEASGDKSGEAVFVNHCTGGPAQRWNWISDRHGRSMVQHITTNRCLHVMGKDMTHGALIGLEGCEAKAAAWAFEEPAIFLARKSGPGALPPDGLRYGMLALIAMAGLGALSLSSELWRRRAEGHGTGAVMTTWPLAVPTRIPRSVMMQLQLDDLEDQPIPHKVKIAGGPGTKLPLLEYLLGRNEAKIPKDQMRQAIDDGKFTAEDGRTLTAEDTVSFSHRRQTIYIHGLKAPHNDPFLPQPLAPLPIVFADADLVAIDKPPGLLSYPLGRNRVAALSILERQFEALKEPTELRPLHRIDIETSGIFLMARALEPDQRMKESFRQKTIKKSYFALVRGDFRHAPSLIDAPIERSSDSPINCKMVVSSSGKPAQTLIQAVYHFGNKDWGSAGIGYTWIQAIPLTGRSHQIRLHLAHLGHALVGDKIYCDDGIAFLRRVAGEMDEKDLARLGHRRQALHARRVRFDHPMTGAALDLVAPLPRDLLDFTASNGGDVSKLLRSVEEREAGKNGDIRPDQDQEPDLDEQAWDSGNVAHCNVPFRISPWTSFPALGDDTACISHLAEAVADFSAPLLCGQRGTTSATFFRIWLKSAAVSDAEEDEFPMVGGQSLPLAMPCAWLCSTRVQSEIALTVSRRTGWSRKVGSKAAVRARQNAAERNLIFLVEIAPPDVDALAWSHGAFRIRACQGEAEVGAREIARHAEVVAPGSTRMSALLACRAEGIFTYDTDEYPFGALFAELLGCHVHQQQQGSTAAPGELLASLHTSIPKEMPLWPKVAMAYADAGISTPREWRRYDGTVKQRLESSAAYCSFMEAYRRFMRLVVAPLCGSDQVVFQCPPTVRIAMPGAPATIRMHTDAEYRRHQDGEVNFWLPLTEVYGTNTLWLESTPGRGDFRPMTLKPGELLRFHGYRCRHYTVPNETKAARVSFDWRAIPHELCTEQISKIGDFPAEST